MRSDDRQNNLTVKRYTVILPAVPDAEFDIKELSQRSGTTPRTVHFYVQQGLLPPAGSLGPRARYGEGHVARLKLIRLLQKQHLPLAEIGRRLKGLTDEQVRELLDETKERRVRGSGSALDYIRSVLGDQSAQERERLPVRAGLPRGDAALSPLRSTRGVAPAAPAAPGSPAAPRAPIAPEGAAAPSAPWAPAAPRSQWERYTLTDGIELNVRRPLARSEQRMLARLLDAARRIFDTTEEE